MAKLCPTCFRIQTYHVVPTDYETLHIVSFNWEMFVHTDINNILINAEIPCIKPLGYICYKTSIIYVVMKQTKIISN